MKPQSDRRETGWTLDTLYTHFTALLEDERRANNQRFSDQEKAVAAALAAAEKAVKAALDAAQKAVDKAESSLVVWKESQNEWRGTIADIISKTLGKGQGLNAGWGYLIAGVGFIIAVMTLFAMFKK